MSGRAEVDEQRSQYRERAEPLEFPNFHFPRDYAGKMKGFYLDPFILAIEQVEPNSAASRVPGFVSGAPLSASVILVFLKKNQCQPIAATGIWQRHDEKSRSIPRPCPFLLRLAVLSRTPAPDPFGRMNSHDSVFDCETSRQDSSKSTTVARRRLRLSPRRLR